MDPIEVKNQEIQQENKEQTESRQLPIKKDIIPKQKSTKVENLKEAQFLFVYGTLKPGHDYVAYNANVYQKKFQTQYIRARLQGYTLIFSNYATLVKVDQNQFVDGYIITSPVDYQGLEAECDRIEGFPSFYEKIEVEVKIALDEEFYNQDKVKAQSYKMREEHYDEEFAVPIGSIFTKEDFMDR